MIAHCFYIVRWQVFSCEIYISTHHLQSSIFFYLIGTLYSTYCAWVVGVNSDTLKKNKVTASNFDQSARSLNLFLDYIVQIYFIFIKYIYIYIYIFVENVEKIIFRHILRSQMNCFINKFWHRSVVRYNIIRKRTQQRLVQIRFKRSTSKT